MAPVKPRYRLVESGRHYLLFRNVNYVGLGSEMYLLPRRWFLAGEWLP